MTHPIHLRTRDITKVEILDDDDINLKVEDRLEKKKEEDDDMEVSDEDIDGEIDGNGEDRTKKTKEVINQYWEEIVTKYEVDQKEIAYLY